MPVIRQCVHVVGRRRQRWNSNLHAFEKLLGLVPSTTQRGLDVGCGEGETARMQRRRVSSVVAIDPDEPSIAEAQSYGDDIDYLTVDLESLALPKGILRRRDGRR
jgi:trans-aconitate methyltransferase